MNLKNLLIVVGVLIFSSNVFATCGAVSSTSTDYTLTTDSNSPCAPPLGATSVTVNSGVTLDGSSTSAGIYISTLEVLSTLSNSGTITSSSNSGVYVGNSSGGSIGTINNYPTGIISNASYGIVVDYSASSIGVINNSGLISGGFSGVDNWGSITTINNYGTFQQTLSNPGYGAAIHNAGYQGGGIIGSVINQVSGIISGTLAGISNENSGTQSSIQVITNFGSIIASQGYGIQNIASAIATLNNAQGAGNTNGALTYTGVLPTNYNIIVNSTSSFGKLAVTSGTGNTTFGISSLSARGSVVIGNYSSIITGVTNTQLGITGTSLMGATSNGYTYDLIETGSGTNIWNLTILSAPIPVPTGPSAADTQSSLEISANALKSIYALQTSSLTAGLTYDCSIFDKNGICVSAGGRYNRVNTGETKAANGLLMGAYKVNPNIRVGAWVDQNLSVNTGTGVNLSNSKPMFGLFGVWNANPSGHGFEARLSAGYGDKDLTVTREAVGSSGEAGTGTARLNAQGVSVVLSYNAPAMVHWVASPYLGARYTKVRAGGYTESDAVTTPLTFGELKQEAATALAGMNVSGRVMSNLGVFAGLGAELDTTTRGNNYSATGVTGLTDIAFNPNMKRLRGSANAGFYLDVDKTQRISLNAIYREEAFASMNTISSMLTYTAGF